MLQSILTQIKIGILNNKIRELAQSIPILALLYQKGQSSRVRTCLIFKTSTQTKLTLLLTFRSSKKTSNQIKKIWRNLKINSICTNHHICLWPLSNLGVNHKHLLTTWCLVNKSSTIWILYKWWASILVKALQTSMIKTVRMAISQQPWSLWIWLTVVISFKSIQFKCIITTFREWVLDNIKGWVECPLETLEWDKILDLLKKDKAKSSTKILNLIICKTHNFMIRKCSWLVLINLVLFSTTKIGSQKAQ